MTSQVFIHLFKKYIVKLFT